MKNVKNSSHSKVAGAGRDTSATGSIISRISTAPRSFWFAIILGICGLGLTVLAVNATTVREIHAGATLLIGLLAGSALVLLVLLGRQRAAQAALRDSDARFRALSALGSDWYWETDAEYRLTQASEGFSRMSGRSGVEILGKPFWDIDFITPVGTKWAAHKAVISRRAPFRNFLLRHAGLQGIVTYASVSGEPVFRADGSLAGYRGVGNGVTAEIVLRQSLRMQHDVTRILGRGGSTDQAIRAVIEVICRNMEWSWGAHRHLDRDTRLLTCHGYWLAPGNKADAFADFARQPKSGYPGKGLLGTAISRGELMWFTDHAPLSPRRSDLARAAGLKGAVVVPIRRKRKDGDALEFFSERIEMPDQVMRETLDSIALEIGQFMDRMDVQEASIHLEREHHQLLDMLERQLAHMPVACVLQDEAFQVVYCNPAAERIFGYSAAELRGLDFASLVLPEFMHGQLKERRARLKAGEMNVTVTHDNIRKDGSLIICEWSHMPLTDRFGKFTGVLATAQDVTERARMIAALEESEARYRKTFDATPLPMWVSEAHSPRLLAVNDATVKKYGYTREELLRMSAIDLQVDEDRDRVLVQLRERDPLLPTQYERRHVTKDGQVINVEVIGQPFQFGGQPARLIIAQDITERQRAQQALAESEARYRQIFALTPLPMFLRHESKLNFIEVNDACLKMYGYTREEMLCMSALDIQTPDGRELYMEGVGVRSSDVVEHLQKQHMSKSGEILDVEIYSYPAPVAGEKVRLVLVRDMRDQLRMERLLRDNEARLRAIADNVPAVIAFFDDKCQLQYSNIAFDRWFGPARLDFSKKVLRVEQEVSSYGDPFQSLLEQVLKGDEISTERKLDTRVGERTVQLTLVPHVADDGAVAGVHLMGYDLTDFRGAEAEVRSLNAELEQRVEQRTRALAAANRELESFSYSVSHDLRAPLRTIDGFSRILLDEYAAKLDVAGRDYLERVRAGSQRMESLIDDLLELARVTRRELQTGVCNLTDLVHEITAELTAGDPGRKVKITVTPDMMVVADPGLLRIVLDNLLRNAWKFTSLKPTAVIEVGCTDTGEERTYFVRDNGAGFEMAYADKLFGAFQRLHSEAEFQGTGVGLALVQRVIRRHGGQIWAEAEPDQGATFYFTLPGQTAVVANLPEAVRAET